MVYSGLNEIKKYIYCREYHVMFKKVKKSRWEFISAFNIMDNKRMERKIK